ncbi:MAG: potassium channel protein [Chloroflexota bacterium]|nr:MAG: potassium channel protein [Chloroflexota bacterium]
MRLFGALQDLVRGLGVLLLVVFTGTIGYKLIEGWSLLDSLYMTIITITTVGYAEVHPLSPAGRGFSIILMLVGVGTAFYILTSLVRYILEGEFGIRIGRQRMEAKIRRFNNHFILCGYGRVGQAIASILRQQEAKFVVIDRDREAIDKAQQAGYLTIQGDATKDESLRQAKIDSARGIIIALGDDAASIYTTLATKELNATLPIVARANNEDAGRKLLQAGAQRVVAPEIIGGARMARLALRPQAVEFIETVLFGREKQLLVEEIETGDESTLVGSTIKEIEERFPGVRILALKKSNGALVPNPGQNSTVEKASSLTAFGTVEQLRAVEGCCQPSKVKAKSTSKSGVS